MKHVLTVILLLSLLLCLTTYRLNMKTLQVMKLMYYVPIGSKPDAFKPLTLTLFLLSLAAPCLASPPSIILLVGRLSSIIVVIISPRCNRDPSPVAPALAVLPMAGVCLAPPAAPATICPLLVVTGRTPILVTGPRRLAVMAAGLLSGPLIQLDTKLLALRQCPIIIRCYFFAASMWTERSPSTFVACCSCPTFAAGGLMHSEGWGTAFQNSLADGTNAKATVLSSSSSICMRLLLRWNTVRGQPLRRCF